MICRVNRSTGKSSRDVKNTDFLSILYNKALTRYNKSKIRFGASENFKEGYSFSKGYKSQFTDENFEISAIATKNSPIYIIKDLDKKKFREIFM